MNQKAKRKLRQRVRSQHVVAGGCSLDGPRVGAELRHYPAPIQSIQLGGAVALQPIREWGFWTCIRVWTCMVEDVVKI